MRNGRTTRRLSGRQRAGAAPLVAPFRRRTIVAGVSVVAALAASTLTPTASASPLDAASGGSTIQSDGGELTGASSRLVAIAPTRVLDTRSDPNFNRLSAGGSFNFAPVTDVIASAAGVSASDVEAVVVNLTAVNAADRGWVKAWPAGEAEPETSSINMAYPGHTIPNLVTMRLGSSNRLTIKAFKATDIVIDVQAVYVRASSATSGRFEPLSPTRAYDSRNGSPIAPKGSVVVDLKPAGVPADALAAVVNVTAAEANGRGYYSVYVPGGAVPTVSNLNVPGANQNVANQAIARLNNGQIAIYSRAGGDVIVDVLGYMTGSSAANSSSGLFVPVTPARFVDSRDSAALTDGCVLRVSIAGRGDIPSNGLAAIVANVTATQAFGRGNLAVTAWQAGQPGVSTVNMLGVGSTVPNHATTLVGNGAVQVLATTGGDVIVDIVGYYTGSTGVSSIESDTGSCVPNQPAYPGSGSQEFLFEVSQTQFARWNPCATLDYWVNIDDAPNQEAVDSMNDAIRSVEEATGVDFVYRGTTSSGTKLNQVDGIDAIIGFSTPSKTSQLGGSVIGVGGGWYNSREVLYGYAFVDVTDGLGNGDRLRAVFMHELAHMMGLAHVNDSNELMFPFATSRTTFGVGDLEGLYLMGSAQGCLASSRLQVPGVPGAPLQVPEPVFHAGVIDEGHGFVEGDEPGHSD